VADSAATTLAKTSFWLDGGYDFENVMACPYHPEHRWWTFRVGDVVKNCGDPDERMTICRACYVPRCGSTGDVDRCKLWRHHETEHVYESGAKEAVGGF
jgi:hypothetical protein